MDVVNNPGLNAVCATVTCCGTIFDYKSNFQGRENEQRPEQGNNGNNIVSSNHTGKHKFAWMLALWRVLLWGVAIFNVIMDGIFIGSLYTDKEVEKTYAHLMLGTSLLSIVSELFVYGPLINAYVKIIRDWKDRLEVLTLCFVSALVCYWVEDVTTIYLYFKVDGVYDTDNIADVINLFSSIIAGCISLLSLVILPVIVLAARFGAFDQDSTCCRRCCGVFACCLYVSFPNDDPQRELSEEQKKEQRKSENIMTALVAMAIVATVYPSYVAIFQIFLNGGVSGEELVCEDSGPFYSAYYHSNVRCDWIDLSSCDVPEIRQHCRLTCNSCDEAVPGTYSEYGAVGITDELLIVSIGIGVVTFLAGLFMRIKVGIHSAEVVRQADEERFQKKVYNKFRGVNSAQQMKERIDNVEEC